MPSYFDPAETTLGTAFMVLNGLHDALVKPMPGKAVAASLAASWRTSPDGLTYEFTLRKGVRFHNGEPVTFINGVGRRVEESGLALIAGYAFSAPYEDVKVRGKERGRVGGF